jgi:hypothetical protein
MLSFCCIIYRQTLVASSRVVCPRSSPSPNLQMPDSSFPSLIFYLGASENHWISCIIVSDGQPGEHTKNTKTSKRQRYVRLSLTAVVHFRSLQQNHGKMIASTRETSGQKLASRPRFTVLCISMVKNFAPSLKEPVKPFGKA